MNKFHAEETPCHQGHIHQSGIEAGECDRLKIRMQNKEFAEYFSQYDFDLLAAAPTSANGIYDIKKVGTVVVDFWIPELNEIREVKGGKATQTAVWKIKWAILKANRPDLKYTVVEK